MADLQISPFPGWPKPAKTMINMQTSALLVQLNSHLVSILDHPRLLWIYQQIKNAKNSSVWEIMNTCMVLDYVMYASTEIKN